MAHGPLFIFSGGYPVYKNTGKGLTLLDILSICTNSCIDDERLCVRTPYPKSDSVF